MPKLRPKSLLKQLLKSAQVFDYINHSEEDFGIKVKEANVLIFVGYQRSRDVNDGMSKGIDYLLKKNKIEVIYGHGKIVQNNKVSVTKDDKRKEYSFKHIIIGAGALEVESYQT